MYKLVVTLIKNQTQKHIPLSAMTNLAKVKIFVMLTRLDLTMVLNYCRLWLVEMI
jgi:hypothetical protein